MAKRVFLVVLDSFGVGEEPDAASFGDYGVTRCVPLPRAAALTVLTCAHLDYSIWMGLIFSPPSLNLWELLAVFASVLLWKRNTTIGHWELAGLESSSPLPTYPHGFPPEIIQKFEQRTGRSVLCNKPYSGTEVLKDFGEEHLRTGSLIVYTSADSVFQIAANETIVPVDQLYEYCRAVRSILVGEHGVGRVIARPFEGTCRKRSFGVRRAATTILCYLPAEQC